VSYLTVQQAAEATGYSTKWIYNGVRSGELHGSQRSKTSKWLIRRECLDAWVAGEKCEHQATTPQLAAR
jgi:excisionase family DNA binding protein